MSHPSHQRSIPLSATPSFCPPASLPRRQVFKEMLLPYKSHLFEFPTGPLSCVPTHLVAQGSTRGHKQPIHPHRRWGSLPSSPLAAGTMEAASPRPLLFLAERGETFPTNALLDKNMQFWTGLNYSYILGSRPK